MTLVRKTSQISWQMIKDTGYVTGQRELVAELLYRSGPLTGTEVNQRLKGPGEISPNYHKRLSELQDQQVIEPVGHCICPIKGTVVILWDISGKLPTKLEKTKSTSPTTPKDFDLGLNELRGIRQLLLTEHGIPFSFALIRVLNQVQKKYGTKRDESWLEDPETDEVANSEVSDFVDLL